VRGDFLWRKRRPDWGPTPKKRDLGIGSKSQEVEFEVGRGDALRGGGK